MNANIDARSFSAVSGAFRVGKNNTKKNREKKREVREGEEEEEAEVHSRRNAESIAEELRGGGGEPRVCAAAE